MDPNGLQAGETLVPLAPQQPQQQQQRPAPSNGLQPGETAVPLAPQQAPPAPPPPAAPAKEPGLFDRIGGLLKDGYNTVSDAIGEGQKGVVKGAMQTVGGTGQMMFSGAVPGNVPGADVMNALSHVKAVKSATDWIMKHGETHGVWQGLGSAGESMAEFLVPGVGEEAMAADGAKAVSYADKLAEAQKAAQFLEKTQMGQRISHLAAVGARTVKAAMTGGTEAGLQTLIKTGGDTDQAQDAAVAGAAGGAILTPLAEGAGAFIRHISPTVEDIGGVPITRLASQNPHATTAQAMAATAEHSSAVQSAQQEAGQQIIGNSARSAAARNLEELNAGRRTPPPPARPELPASTEPYQFRISGTPLEETVTHGSAEPSQAPTGAGVKQVPNPNYRAPETLDQEGIAEIRRQLGVGEDELPTGSFTGPQTFSERAVQHYPPATGGGSVVRSQGGDILTQDSATAKAHIANLSDAIESPGFDSLPPERQQALLDQRADMQRQMSEYHASQAAYSQRTPGLYDNRSAFAPVNISATVAKVGSFGDAADALEGGAKEVYQRLDDLTGGRFSELREENKRAWNAVTNGQEGAQARLQRSQDEMNRMLGGKDPQVGQSVNNEDLAFGNEAWKKAQVLRDVHSKVESAFDTAIGTSDRTNAYRGFNGNRLRSNLKTLTDQYGERPLIRVIGQDQFDNLTRLADITRTQSDRAQFGGGVNHVAQWIIKNEGKVASGVAAGGGTVGGFVGGPAGAATGAATAEALYGVTRRVMRAIATDPKVGAQMTYALKYGARPQNYAPLIGALVRAAEEKQTPEQEQ